MNSVQVLYENDELLVINKPSGLAVQGGEGVSHSLDKDFSLELGYKIYLVHRLDKDTAGLMIVAKSPYAAAKWTKLIGSKEVRKEYVAVCCGSLAPEKGVIEDSVVQHGVTKKAKTLYSVEKKCDVDMGAENDGSGGKIGTGAGGSSDSKLTLSWLRLKLETGRMHQIRIHLSKNGCPIAGDEQHGNFKLNKILRKKLGIKKLLLASVKLILPLDGKQKTFEIDLPEYMNFDFEN
ncbi:MAG: RluA family pseudouridine synthase [Treponema sp.]|nr:RluA family pseudouridine synthase [Treponema sp.]